MHMAIILLILATIVISCSVEPKEEPEIVSHMSFEGWEKLPKLNIERMRSEGHLAYIDLHANKLGKEAYEQRVKEFPVGSKIFKPIYTDQKQSECDRLTVMIKMSPGYDSENGDWWYGVYDKSGKEAWHQGKIQSCIDCHKLAKDMDYLFTESVMDEIEIQKAFGSMAE